MGQAGTDLTRSPIHADLLVYLGFALSKPRPTHCGWLIGTCRLWVSPLFCLASAATNAVAIDGENNANWIQAFSESLACRLS